MEHRLRRGDEVPREIHQGIAGASRRAQTRVAGQIQASPRRCLLADPVDGLVRERERTALRGGVLGDCRPSLRVGLCTNVSLRPPRGLTFVD
jgi:hypothetical protein